MGSMLVGLLVGTVGGYLLHDRLAGFVTAALSAVGNVFSKKEK
jgi:hypothetical protein